MMIAQGEGGSWPYIEAAKYYEHVQKDIAKALLYAKAALSCELNQQLYSDSEQDERLEALRRRIKRLMRKQGIACGNAFEEDGR